MKRVLWVVCAVAAIGFWAAPAPADDWSPPPWRGQPLSVRAEWEFSGPPSNWYYILPEQFQSWGDGVHPLMSDWLTHAEVNSYPGWVWESGDGDGQVKSINGDTIAFKVANFIDEMPMKLVQIQITWTGPGGQPSVIGVTGNEQGIPVPGTIVSQPNLGSHTVETWQIIPNPDWEMIVIHVPAGQALDQVVIDTISPEPATLSLLALGGLALVRRRRR